MAVASAIIQTESIGSLNFTQKEVKSANRSQAKGVAKIMKKDRLAQAKVAKQLIFFILQKV
ncbi:MULTISPECIES: hypothetical protein [unclassified Campylobacter]|uniref:hypothetical protein n=1 Tax=unclassified Campylobacter TaxID=2593542 RepID=UPI00147432C1|nr:MULTISPECIES: hypothetical protein [unclassified Campylobacter]